VDFLYTIALTSDPCDALALLDYARFLAVANQKYNTTKRTFFLLRSVCACHANTEAVEELRNALISLNMAKEVRLLELWSANK
jgi:hypothetical protein